MIKKEIELNTLTSILNQESNDNYKLLLNEKIKQFELEKFVIIKDLKDPINIIEECTLLYSNYKIVIKNLKVKINERSTIKLNRSTDNFSEVAGYLSFVKVLGHLVIEMINIDFINSSDNSTDLVFDVKNTYLNLSSCNFVNLPIAFDFESSYLFLLNNNFENQFTTFIGKKNKVDQYPLLILNNNIFKGLDLFNKKSFLAGRNEISYFSNRSLNPKNFGQNNLLDKENEYFVLNKGVINSWYYDSTNDYLKKQKLRRELLNIELQIIKKEKKETSSLYNYSLKDEFLLKFEKYTNDFKLNWFLSFKWIILIQLLFCMIVLLLNNYEVKFNIDSILFSLGLYFELLNPTRSIARTINLESHQHFWEGISFIKNFILSILFFQLISAFRKFSLK